MEKQNLKFFEGNSALFSLWFMLHEISNHKVKNLKQFLQQVYNNFPSSSLVIGEIVRLEDKILNEIYNKSLMPEYLFS